MFSERYHLGKNKNAVFYIVFCILAEKPRNDARAFYICEMTGSGLLRYMLKNDATQT